MSHPSTPPENRPGSGNHASPFKGSTGFKRLKNAFGYSLHGLKAAYAHEDAFRQETWLSLILILATFFLPVSRLEQALMIASVFLVLIVELLNSALEAVVDRIGLERHDLSKRAKDIGSAAVLVALLNAGAVWLCILWRWYE